MKRLSRASFRLSSKDQVKVTGCEIQQAPPSPSAMRDLHDFLVQAELCEYHSALSTLLKVSCVEHLKYVREQDLQDVGMTRPEIRRLRKFYKREFPQGAISKLRKAILKGGGDGAGRTLSPASPTRRNPPPVPSNVPYMRPPGRQLIAAEAIQFGGALGQGEFGVVQQGIWKTEFGETLQVAVKRLSREKVNTGSQNFLKEAAIMQDVDHEHIVRMFGVVLDREDNLMLVTELAPMRSLLECIKDPTLRADLTVPRLCDFAVQVCDGMSYLESKRLVHRDLAARNILVFNKNLVKISDLGLSRLLGVGQDYYQSKFSPSLKLPIAWCAPECINFLKFTSASDVWSFGVTLWELFTYGFQPWAGLSGQQILQTVDEPASQRLEQPELCTNEMYKLMKECWIHDPEARPTFSNILLRLPQLKPTQVKALKDYPSPLAEKGYISYKAGDVIVVINKSPVTTSPPGLVWKGALVNGKCGLFDPTNAVPFIEPAASVVPAQAISIVRKDSTRRSGKKIRVDMISQPQNDLRHTGHIGYDGAVFGDVSFIADNYDKLPVKTSTGNATNQGPHPLPRNIPDINGHAGTSSHQDNVGKATNGHEQSWQTSRIGQESLSSQPTCQVEQDGRYSPNYLDIEDDSLLSDFKMPDLGRSFDFGPSFMDEVLKALDEKEKQLTDVTPSPGKTHFLDPNIWISSTRTEPPLPAPRESRTPSSSLLAPPLPAQQLQQQRVVSEHLKEKKQAKIKPMSASDEKMVDSAMARARELTSHMIGGAANSPPVSPSQTSSFFGDDTGIISRLKNSIKRSSPKSEHKRTFSDDLENKGDLGEVTPEAQQAYNMLVVKGSFKEKPGSHSHQHSLDVPDSKRSRGRTSAASFQESELSDWFQPDLTRDSKSSPSSTKIWPQTSSSLLTPSSTGASPTSQPQNKPAGTSLSRSTPGPVPIPRPVQTEDKKKSEDSTTWSHPESQQASSYPDIPSRYENKLETHLPDLESKMTTEIVRILNDSGSDDVFKASTSFEHSSRRSSQRLSTDSSDNLSDSESGDWEHKDLPDSHKVNPETNTEAVIRRTNTSSKKQTSLFEEDLNAPTPQEIMNKLRERRLNQQLDHKRTQAADRQPSNTGITSRSQTCDHGLLNIPSRVPKMNTLEGGRVGEGNEEADTNPLRMLRGGTVPIRTTGRGTAGTGNFSNRGAVALRVPRLNFSIHLSRSVADQQKTDVPLGNVVTTNITEPPCINSLSVAADTIRASGNESAPPDCGTAAEMTRDVEQSSSRLSEVGQSINPLAESNNLQAPKVVANGGIETNQKHKILTKDLHLDLTVPLPPTSASSQPCHGPSSQPQTTSVDSDDSSIGCLILDEVAPAPPRLPPRRSQSLNENSEKCGSHLSLLSDGLRRSNSVDEGNDTELPALPPRKPHAGRIPLNTRPRERKFPLQIHLPSQVRDPKQQPTSPQPAMTPASPQPMTATSKHVSHLRSPVHTSPSPLTPTQGRQHPLASTTPPRLHKQSQSPVGHSLNSPTITPSHRQPALHNSFNSKSPDSPITNHHHHHSSSLDLPPAYDISVRHALSSNVADSEPTHMLLDPHNSHLPLPLTVSLPPSTDLTSVDEPTHVSLSSLIDNKHSWSATFTSPSPLSPLFSHRQHISSQGVVSPRLTRAFDRSISSDPRIRGPTLYPDSSDSQSPPADLPPAPPTPSYREKLGLEPQKPKVARSISHTPSGNKCGSHLLTVDSASSQSSFRGRSASTNSPTSGSHVADTSVTSPTQSSNRVFHFTHRSDDINDDAFFAEAPTYPHPYSQTPFHPLFPSSPKDIPESSTVYSTIPFLQTPDISPYQISSTIPHNNPPPRSMSPHSLSWTSSNQHPSTRHILDSYNTPSHLHTTDRHNCTPNLLPDSTNSSHIYNTVSLPCPALMSPSNSRTSLKNSPAKSNNPTRPGHQTATPLKPHLASSQQTTKCNIFKFPSVIRTDGIVASSSPLTTSAAAQSGTYPRNKRNPDLSPSVDDPSSSEVSPLMFASYSAASSVSYEDLRQFALDRQKNCEEIETLLKIFPDQVTVDECMTALESTQWEVSKATKYLQLKKLLSLGVADVHRCKEALSASGWDLQCAAETLLESARPPAVSSSARGSSSARSPIITSRNRPATPEIVDV